jgi:peroxiredoxin
MSHGGIICAAPNGLKLQRCDRTILFMKPLYLLAVTAVVAALGLGLHLGSGAKAAPMSAFVLLDGSTRISADFKGRVTLVNFWATSCTSCVAEMPQLVDTYNKYHGRGYDTIAVAMRYDPPSSVVNFTQTRQLPFQVAIDNTGLVAHQWGDVQLTPTSYLVDKQGQIVKRYVGAPDFTELHKLLETLLANT